MKISEEELQEQATKAAKEFFGEHYDYTFSGHLLDYEEAFKIGYRAAEEKLLNQ